jgi:hypothetical protein
MPQVISHPTFGNVSFPDDFTNQQIADSFKNLENLQKPKAQEKQTPMSETAMNMASDIAVEGGVSTTGQLAGAFTGPGYFVLAPLSGYYGNYLKQQQQIARGERKEFSQGEAFAAALINLLPAANATKTLAKVGVDLAAKPLGTKIAYTAGLRAVEGAGIGGLSKTLEQTIEEGTFPTQDDFLSAVKAGGALGAVVGAGEAGLTAAFPKLSRGASKMWDTFAGKKASDVGAQLDNLRVNGTPEEKAAATEIIDEVGQRLGLIRKATGKSAEESAREMLGYQYIPEPGTRPAREAAEAFQQLTPAESERQLIEMGLKREGAAPSAMESAAAMGVLPVKPAREAAQTLAQAPLTAEEQAARFVGTLQPKSAMESASAMGVLPVRPAREAAETLAQAPLTAEEQAARFVAGLEPKSAAESASLMGALPVKSAKEAAELLSQVPLTPEEKVARFVASLQPKSAAESAELLGMGQPLKSARESAEVFKTKQRIKKTTVPTDEELQIAADSQRGIPESQMYSSVKALQDAGGPEMYNHALEHVGDLADRLQEPRYLGSMGATDKLPRLMRMLFPAKGRDSFEKEIESGLRGAAEYKVLEKHPELEVPGEPNWMKYEKVRAQYANEIEQNIAKAREEMVRQGKEYAKAHREHNKPITYAGKLGRDAAIALGEMDFKKLREIIPELNDFYEANKNTPNIYLREKPSAKKGKASSESGFITPETAIPLARTAAGAVIGATQGETPEERATYAALGAGAGALASPKLFKAALSKINKKANTIEEAIADKQGIKPVSIPKGQGSTVVSETNPNVQKALQELNIPKSERKMSLEDVDRLFEEPKEKTKFLSISDRLAELFQNSFRPVGVLEEKIRGYSPKFNLADRFSLIGGAGAKAEPAIREMENVRNTLVGDIHPKDINRYFVLNRAANRLARGILTEKLSIEDTSRLLTDLRANLGQDKVARLERFSQYMQDAADADLKMMVSSGRMSQQLYDEIKAKNDFYAPFHFTNKVGEIDAVSQRFRSGSAIDTQAELAKELQGFDSQDLKLGDIFTAFKRNKYNAHILAEKSAAMNELVELAMLDKNGDYAKFIKRPKDAPPGFEAISYLSDGKTKYLAVDASVARAVSGLSPIELGVVGKLLQVGGLGLRAGATSLNAAWLVTNFPLDFARQMMMSKYGLKSPKDLIPWAGYAADFGESLASSIKYHLPGRFSKQDDLYRAYLESGAARSNFQSVINQDAFTQAMLRGDDTALAKFIDVSDKYILGTPGKIANALEDTIKLMGLKRAMRFENVNQLTPEAREKMMREIAYEVRNYAGSPDFGKFGSLGRQANLLFIFANARGQGVAADVARLSGRTGTKEARDAWLRVGIAFGLPATLLWSLNHLPENAEDYSKLSERDKTSFFNIPLSDENGPKYNTDKYGRKVRDYLRIPKRDIPSIMANTIEKTLDFYASQKPQEVYEWANAMADSISPISISGNTLAERGMSVASSLNPAIRVPFEQISNVEFFRKRPIVSPELKEVRPEFQYEESTPEIYKDIAKAVPGVSPLRLQNVVQGFTGGAVSQFVKKPQEGRNELASNPLLSRYFRSGSIDESADFERIQQLRSQQADRGFIREMEIDKALDAALAAPMNQRQQIMRSSLPPEVISDPNFSDTLVRLLVDKQLQVTPLERRIRSLQPSERAQYIHERISTMKREDEKRTYIGRMATIPGMFTDDVAKFLVEWKKADKPSKQPQPTR